MHAMTVLNMPKIGTLLRTNVTSPQSEAGIPTHDSNHMSELSIEYSSALEREKELCRRYEDLFSFLRNHIKDSQVSTWDKTCSVDSVKTKT